MESIPGDNQHVPIHPLSNGLSVKSPSTINQQNLVPENTKTNLHALTDLSNLAHSSAPDIREAVVENAKRLLEDPNWLSDDNLESLSAKILQNENFN
jgi:hypothetical protein